MIAMKKILFILVSAIAVLVSCTRAERFDLVGGDDLQVRFSAAMDHYSVKSSDAGFDNGDAISITALSPINADNVKYVYRDGILVPEKEGISWVAGQKTPSMFFALYPYRENFHMNNDGTFGDFEDVPEGLLIEVEPDQSTYEGYSRSNQLLASSTANPGDESVKLSFRHAVAKVVINVENKLDVRITEVYLKDVYGRYQRWGKGSIGTMGTIKAGVDSVNRWKLVTVPQQASPTIVLKTGDGKEYAFGCPYSGGLYFYAGYQLTLSVVLDESVSSNYTSEIVDWSDDGEVVFDHEAYLRKKQTAALLEELAGDYEATSSAEAYINPWVITVKPANDKIGFVNLFSGNASWATDDMMYFGTLSDDLSSIIIPFWQASEFVYNGSPFYLLGMDANGFNGDLYDEGNATATIVRDPTTGAVTGLDFGDFGFMSYLPNGGYVGYCLPHITATKKVQ